MAQITAETSFEREERNEWAIVRPVGELDAYWATRFKDEIDAGLAATANRVVVDLAGVTFIDSTGIGVLMSAVKRARAFGGDVRLAGVKPFVTKVLEITGLHRVFRGYPTVDEATA